MKSVYICFSLMRFNDVTATVLRRNGCSVVKVATHQVVSTTPSTVTPARSWDVGEYHLNLASLAMLELPTGGVGIVDSGSAMM